MVTLTSFGVLMQEYLVEWIGYIGRIIGANEAPNYTLGPYILQVLLLLLAPTLFAASIYMGLGRVILLVNGNSLSPIRQKILTKIFVAGDVLSFVVQAAGMLTPRYLSFRTHVV